MLVLDLVALLVIRATASVAVQSNTGKGHSQWTGWKIFTSRPHIFGVRVRVGMVRPKSHRGRRIQLVVALAQSDVQEAVLEVMAVVASGLAAAVLAWRP